MVVRPNVTLSLIPQHDPGHPRSIDVLNFTTSNRGAADISSIVMHTTEGHRAQNDIDTFGTDGRNVSYHYIVDGSRIYQLVADKDIAHHAANFGYNAASIGIAIVGLADQPGTISDTEFELSAHLAAWLSYTYGIPVNRDLGGQGNRIWPILCLTD